MTEAEMMDLPEAPVEEHATADIVQDYVLLRRPGLAQSPHNDPLVRQFRRILKERGVTITEGTNFTEEPPEYPILPQLCLCPDCKERMSWDPGAVARNEDSGSPSCFYCETCGLELGYKVKHTPFGKVIEVVYEQSDEAVSSA